MGGSHITPALCEPVNVADVSEIHAATIFKVKMSRVKK
jgi:hypothetical protein